MYTEFINAPDVRITDDQVVEQLVLKEKERLEGKPSLFSRWRNVHEVNIHPNTVKNLFNKTMNEDKVKMVESAREAENYLKGLDKMEFRTFRMKLPAPFKAIQWFKNGDHPEDNCREIDAAEGVFWSEGKVVRYFRHPDNDGDNVCPECGHKMRDHGYMEDNLLVQTNINIRISQTIAGTKVCPGDWVISIYNNPNKYSVISNDMFSKFYEECAPRDDRDEHF